MITPFLGLCSMPLVSNLADKKITHMWRRWGTPQNSLLAFIENFEKPKNLTQRYQKYDHMLYCSWNMVCDTWNCYFSKFQSSKFLSTFQQYFFWNHKTNFHPWFPIQCNNTKLLIPLRLNRKLTVKKNLYLTLHKIEEKQQKKKKDTLQKLDGMFSDNKKTKPQRKILTIEQGI